MKTYIFITLLLLPSVVLAQESRREATPDEIKHLLASGGVKQINWLRNSIEKKSALLKEAIQQGSLTQSQMKLFVEALTNQGRSKDQINISVNQFSDQYFTGLQMKNLHKPLPEEHLKNFEKKFYESELRYEDGKISKEEYENEKALLDKEIAFSHVTQNDELQLEKLKAEFHSIASQNSSLLKSIIPHSKPYPPLKVMVASDFSIDPSSKNSLCDVQADKAVDQLNTQVEAISKPTIQEVWFTWPKDKFEIGVSYDKKRGSDFDLDHVKVKSSN